MNGKRNLKIVLFLVAGAVALFVAMRFFGNSNVSVNIQNEDHSDVILISVADARVDSENQFIAFGGETTLGVGFTDYAYRIDHQVLSYLKFDVSSINSSRTIKSAQLNLYCYHLDGAPMQIQVHESTNVGWNEALIQWENKPAYVSFSSDTQTLLHTNQWYMWNVTGFIKNAISSGKLTLVLDTLTDGGSSSFNSREDETGKPELVINYL